MVPVGILGILGCAAQAQRSARSAGARSATQRSAEVPTVNQSVSQLFHGPAPRSRLTPPPTHCPTPPL